MKWAAVLGALALITAAVASASSPNRPISSDPYTNASSMHKTQVEPHAFGQGNTIVAAFQSGRFFDGGSSNIVTSTSLDAGPWWAKNALPGTTVYQGGPYARVSDPAVAFDAMHNVWLVASLALDASVRGAAILVSRSTNGGRSFANPVTVAAVGGGSFNKSWVACDNWPTSPHYGNCYAEWDDNGLGNLLTMSTSTDGGLTWGSARQPSGSPSGLGGLPIAQPNGNVVVSYTANYGAIEAFRSTNGGATWTSAVTVADQILHSPAGGIRSLPLPSASVDSAGKLYVIWYDCRFRTNCASNDIVMSTSTDGVTWSGVTRIPIDATSSTVDHFLHAIAVDPATSGSSARIAVGYYYYPVSNCNPATCQLDFGFVASSDGGTSWTTPVQLAGPMTVTWLPPTSQGNMVGDFVGVAFAGAPRMAHPVFATATANSGSVFHENMASAGIDVASLAGHVRAHREVVRVGKFGRGPGRALPGDTEFPSTR